MASALRSVLICSVLFAVVSFVVYGDTLLVWGSLLVYTVWGIAISVHKNVMTTEKVTHSFCEVFNPAHNPSQICQKHRWSFTFELGANMF